MAYDVLQASIWQQRRTEFESGVNDFDQRINSTSAGDRQPPEDVQDQARLEIAAKWSP